MTIFRQIQSTRMMQQRNAEISQFFDSQAAYATVIEHNYMMHADIIRWIRGRFGERPGGGLRVLETGCGDAYVLSRLAPQIGVQSYTGIDLAANSLEAARTNLDPVIPGAALIQGDLMEELIRLDGAFDLILAGYVLHHFETQVKRQVLAEIHRLLSENGMFILYDITSQDNEPREAYLLRAMDLFDTEWTALHPSQLSEIRRHVLNYDYPESMSSWQELAASNQLQCVAETPLDRRGLFGAMQFVAASR